MEKRAIYRRSIMTTIATTICHLLDQSRLAYAVLRPEPLVFVRVPSTRGEFVNLLQIQISEAQRRLSMRSVGFQHVPAEHPHLDLFLAFCTTYNFREAGLATLCWDRANGEVVVQASLLADATQTVAYRPLMDTLHEVAIAIDTTAPMVARILATGNDPFEKDSTQAAAVSGEEGEDDEAAEGERESAPEAPESDRRKIDIDRLERLWRLGQEDRPREQGE